MAPKPPLNCNGCGAQIYFDAKLPRSKTGKMIPQDFLKPGTPHDCPNRKQFTSKPAEKFNDPIIDNLPSSEESIAHKAVQNSTNYSDGAKKGHEENVQMHKERMEVDGKLLTAIQNLTESVNALIKRMDASEGI